MPKTVKSLNNAIDNIETAEKKVNEAITELRSIRVFNPPTLSIKTVRIANALKEQVKALNKILNETGIPLISGSYTAKK